MGDSGTDRDPVSRAREALAAARAGARERGVREPASRPGPGENRAGPVRQPPARRQRRDDPQALAAAIDGLVRGEGWDVGVVTGSLFSRWSAIVGPDLAQHAQPESLSDGVLTVTVDSTAWATQLRLLAADLLRRIEAEAGAGLVRTVRIRGPVTMARQPGRWRVRGSRGPRDTYG